MVLLITINLLISNLFNIYLQALRIKISFIGISSVLVLGFLVPFFAGQTALRRSLEIEPKDALSQ